MIYQNDKSLHPEIQEIGCFFRSCLWIAEDKTGRQLSSDQINRLYIRSKDLGLIDQNTLITVQPHRIIQEAFFELGDARKVYQNGIFKDGKTTWWPWANNTKKFQRIDALIQKVVTVNGNDHFRVVDRYGRVLFDPYLPQPETTRIIYSTLYYIGD